jgi:CO dehydrogenase/acetyl-CoA synthase beta subunit
MYYIVNMFYVHSLKTISVSYLWQYANYFVFLTAAKEVKQDVSEKWRDVRGQDDVSYGRTLCLFIVCVNVCYIIVS